MNPVMRFCQMCERHLLTTRVDSLVCSQCRGAIRRRARKLATRAEHRKSS